MLKVRIELQSESGEVLDIVERSISESDNVGAFLDGIRSIINERFRDLAVAFYDDTSDIDTRKGG